MKYNDLYMYIWVINSSSYHQENILKINVYWKDIRQDNLSQTEKSQTAWEQSIKFMLVASDPKSNKGTQVFTIASGEHNDLSDWRYMTGYRKLRWQTMETLNDMISQDYTGTIVCVSLGSTMRQDTMCDP